MTIHVSSIDTRQAEKLVHEARLNANATRGNIDGHPSVA